MIKQVRDSEGKETQAHHYSNNANLLNRIVLGVTAAKYRKDNDFTPSDNLRDTLSTGTLDCLSALEVYNTSFIAASIDYTTRKDMLTKIYMRDYRDYLVKEHILLEA